MIENQTFWAELSANGSAVTFATDIVAKSASDIAVYYRADASTAPVLLTYITDYTVSGLGTISGISVVTTATYASDATLAIYRNSAKTQLLDLERGVTIDPAQLENQLDKMALQIQELDARMQQCFKYPDWEGNNGQPVVLDKTERTNTLAGFDSSGNFYHYTIDPDLLELVAPTNVGTVDIVDGAVTAVKLASTLDLSSKTLTFPATSVTAANLASTLDLSAKTLTLPTSFVTSKSLTAGSVVSDHTLGSLTLTRLKLGSGYPSLSVSGAESTAANTTYVYSSTVSGRPKYVASNSYYIQWTGSLWKIYTDAAVALYSSKTGNGWTTPDQVGAQWEVGSGDSGTPAAPSITTLGNELDVNGIVSATSFRGDISQCTGGAVPIPVVALPSNVDRCIVAKSCFIGQDKWVYVAGSNSSNQLSPVGALSLVKNLIRPAFAEGAPAAGVTAGLNGGTDTVVSVVSLAQNTFALTASGFVYAMGVGSSGQLGQGSTTTYSYFRAIRFDNAGANTPISKIYAFEGQAAGSRISCFAIDTSGKAWAWGENSHGQLGIGGTTDQTTPTKIANLSAKTVTKIVGAGLSSYFLCSDGSVYSAGNNSTGALGLGNLTQTTSATVIPNTGSTIIAADIAASGSYSAGTTEKQAFALIDTTSSKTWVCGYGIDGAIGDGLSSNQNALKDISLGLVTSIYGVGMFSAAFVAFRSDSTARVWGYNASVGALGTGSAANVTSVTNPTALSTALAGTSVVDCISIGNAADGAADLVLVLLANGSVYGCGCNTSYQLADGTATSATTFRKIGLPSGVTGIRGTSTNSWTFLDSFGKLWAVGDNASYQAGQGNNDTTGYPVQIRL